MHEGTMKERLTAATYKLTGTVHLGHGEFSRRCRFPFESNEKKGCQKLTRVHQKNVTAKVLPSPTPCLPPFAFPVCCCCSFAMEGGRMRCSQICQFFRIKETSNPKRPLFPFSSFTFSPTFTFTSTYTHTTHALSLLFLLQPTLFQLNTRKHSRSPYLCVNI